MSKKTKKIVFVNESNSSDTDDGIFVNKWKNKKKKYKKKSNNTNNTKSSDAKSSDTKSPNLSDISESSDSSYSSEDFYSDEEIVIKKKDNSSKILPPPNNEVNTVKKNKPVKNSNEIFKELIKKQLPDVPSQWRLNINDMKRICKYIDTSIFDDENCCLWNGYITNINNSNKGTYVNFYFRNKKVALHRLLYSNFVAPLSSSEYLKFNCDNKGVCCNINHYEKYKYSKNNVIVKKDIKQKEHKKETKKITITGSDDPDKLIINFD
ncbi:hypothetical protein QLL95_gp0867 [Cotonvirus japonicus]|uniref:Uncharacterized protein n=1 Tax=Cotonvirus japonicus TaxID=2811091 RepID=A0ABM7NT08_9VIRU|nr:hypothetical protein QLL95_gp0867 [Cotonvirus japonicus]BCS83256.1 hypothetical protein [Cotonvirus japonicus]